MTSRNTPTRTYIPSTEEVYIITHTLSRQLSPHKSLCCTPTIHVYVYTCIVGRNSTLTASWVVDSAAAVHEAAATLGFTLKKEQEKSLLPLRKDMMSL